MTRETGRSIAVAAFVLVALLLLLAFVNLSPAATTAPRHYTILMQPDPSAAPIELPDVTDLQLYAGYTTFTTPDGRLLFVRDIPFVARSK